MKYIGNIICATLALNGHKDFLEYIFLFVFSKLEEPLICHVGVVGAVAVVSVWNYSVF